MICWSFIYIYTYIHDVGHIYFDDCLWYIMNYHHYQNEITCSGTFIFFVILVGWNSKAAATYQNLVNKFPSDITVRKKLGVSYLLMGQNEKARRVFSDVSLYLEKYLCWVCFFYSAWFNTPEASDWCQLNLKELEYLRSWTSQDLSSIIVDSRYRQGKQFCQGPSWIYCKSHWQQPSGKHSPLESYNGEQQQRDSGGQILLPPRGCLPEIEPDRKGEEKVRNDCLLYM